MDFNMCHSYIYDMPDTKDPVTVALHEPFNSFKHLRPTNIFPRMIIYYRIVITIALSFYLYIYILFLEAKWFIIWR